MSDGSASAQISTPPASPFMRSTDGGGSNGYRVRLWKIELQMLADKLKLPITVVICRLVPASGTKSSIAFFSFISINWRAKGRRRIKSLESSWRVSASHQTAAGNRSSVSFCRRQSDRVSLGTPCRREYLRRAPRRSWSSRSVSPSDRRHIVPCTRFAEDPVNCCCTAQSVRSRSSWQSDTILAIHRHHRRRHHRVHHPAHPGHRDHLHRRVPDRSPVKE
jgi:hypothetical protein